AQGRHSLATDDREGLGHDLVAAERAPLADLRAGRRTEPQQARARPVARRVLRVRHVPASGWLGLTGRRLLLREYCTREQIAFTRVDRRRTAVDVAGAAAFDRGWECSRLSWRCVHYARPRRTLSHCPGRRRAREATRASLGRAMKITTDDSVPQRKSAGGVA